MKRFILHAPTLFRRVLQSRWLDRIGLAMFLTSLVVMCFIGGAYIAEFDLPWYQRVLKPSFEGLRAVREQRAADWKTDGWYVARGKKTGTAVHRPELACDGLTLYTSLGESCGATLVSMTGEIVHQWSLPFREAWPEAPHVAKPIGDERIHWRRVRLFPNGDLLADYTGIADTPGGYGLVKVDKNSRPIWKYAQCAHHDFDVDAAGQVYTLTHAIRRGRVDGAPHLKAPMLEDFVAVLSPDGDELQRIAIFDAFAKSKFSHFLASIESDEKGDHTHANTIDVISEAFAAKHDFCSAGDVMISLRNPGLLAIINLRRQEVVWAARGIWQRQHDSDPLDNGNILLFDNRGNYGAGGRSRILEWNPETGAIEWCYRGSRSKPFESVTRGSQQLLPNGNVLITESNNGRLLEVTRDGKIAWEYFNPHRAGDDKELVAVVCSAVRYRADELTFLGEQGMAELQREPAGSTRSR